MEDIEDIQDVDEEDRQRTASSQSLQQTYVYTYRVGQTSYPARSGKANRKELLSSKLWILCLQELVQLFETANYIRPSWHSVGGEHAYRFY
jgi:hypothetical protein